MALLISERDCSPLPNRTDDRKTVRKLSSGSPVEIFFNRACFFELFLSLHSGLEFFESLQIKASLFAFFTSLETGNYFRDNNG